MTTNYTFLKVLQFKDISYWDVMRLSFSQEDLSKKFPLIKLERILSPRKEKIKKQEYDGKEQIVSKISFSDGKLHLRDDKKTGMDLYKLHKNDLLVSNINFHQGAVSINDVGMLLCSTHYQPYIVDYTKVNAKYLILVLRSSKFLDYVVRQKTNGIKTEAHYNFIKELKIPLPSIKEQEEIVAKYEKLKNSETEKNKEVQNLKDSIDGYIFSTLGIEEVDDITEGTKLFNTVHYNQLDLWDIKTILNKQNFLNSSKYTNYCMSEILTINPRTVIPNNKRISFIPMENIDETCGKIKKLEEKNSADAKGYTKFMNEDIIWAKITPCMQNGKSAIAKNLKNGYGCGSTEFHVIRNDKKASLIRIEFIYELLRMKKVLLAAQKTFTGACGQQRVPSSFLSQLCVPIPPTDIQDQIINDIATKRNAIERLIQESIQLGEKAISNFEQEVFN